MTSQTLEEAQSAIPARSVDTPTKMYKGGCHCGKFKFECRHPVLEDGFEVVSCNCSLCTQRGYLSMYIFDPKDFRFLKGTETELTHYQFNKKIVTHMFCPVCGSGIFGKVGAKMNTIIAINARTLVDIDVEKLKLKKVNGRAV